MIDPRLSDEIRARLIRSSVDWGNAYAGLSAEGEAWAYPESAAQATGLAALSPLGGATLTSALEPLRRTPSHQSEQISQVRTGEWLTCLVEENEWTLVAGEDGYVGWARNWVLRRQSDAERQEQLDRQLGRVLRVRDTLWASDHWASSPVWRGMPLLTPAEGERRRGGQVLVELPHGATGWLPDTALEQPPATASRARALDAARSLLGTPYVWGGRSPGGLDCSAYVQLAAQLAGFQLPRDARQQVACGEVVPAAPEAWQSGDLLFFGDPPDHVGFADGRGGMLHCSAFARWQKLGDIPQLVGRLSHVRRLTADDLPRRRTLWQHPVTSLDSAS